MACEACKKRRERIAALIKTVTKPVTFSTKQWRTNTIKDRKDVVRS